MYVAKYDSFCNIQATSLYNTATVTANLWDLIKQLIDLYNNLAKATVSPCTYVALCGKICIQATMQFVYSPVATPVLL